MITGPADMLYSTLVQLGVYLRIACEIGLIAFLIYSALLFVRGTRAVTILTGIAVVVIGLTFLSRFLSLEVIDWILRRTWTFFALSVLVIFQPEIRRAFAEIGSGHSRFGFDRRARREKELVSVLIDATFQLSNHRIGALFAIEQSIGTRAYAETGTYINAPVSVELLTTIFFPNTPLHDGGVIIRGDEIIAAGCLFPLSSDMDLSSDFGTRHRAAIGLTEETDCVVIVVSEESGSVSLAHRGRIVRGIERDRLERHLLNYIVKTHIENIRSGHSGGKTDLSVSTEDATALNESGVKSIEI